MTNFLRKIVLPTTIAIFCALIALSAYVASTNIRSLQRYAAQRIEVSDIRSDIVAIELDLQAIETGQRGFLLTGEASYLAPYTSATAQLPGHFAALRSRLAENAAGERVVEAELEKVAQAKIAESDETIRLRQKGYRHRAFLIVDSNRGKELMDRAHVLIGRLSDVQTTRIAQYDSQLETGGFKALAQSATASIALLALTVLALVGFHQQTKRLERKYARQTEELRITTDRLERFTVTLSQSLLMTAAEMRQQAESLLNSDGGFLPHTGQQRAEWIVEASGHVERVVEDLLGNASTHDAESYGEHATAEYPTTRTA